MASIGKLHSNPHNPSLYKILLAASYNNLEIDVNEFQLGTYDKSPEFLQKFHHSKVPTFESADGVILTESGAIAYYVASHKENNKLLGDTKNDAFKVLNYVIFSETEITPHINTWINPILKLASYNKQAHTSAVESLTKSLDVLEKVLLHKTFLVTERVTLADISVACALYPGFKHVLDAESRKKYKNVTRWYVTLINQQPFKKVLGDAPLVEVAEVWTPPKKEEKKKEPKQEQPKKEAKKAKVEPADEDEEEEKPAPKPKSKLDLLPPSKFVLDEWKRFYSNNPTRPDAINWFWEHFDPEGYSIWRVDYKYNDELERVYQSANLIGGFYNRLERARKYAFGNLLVLGEDKNNKIAGYFVIRGLEVPEEVTDAADYDSYTFEKVDHTDPTVRTSFEDYLAEDRDIDGRKCADGKTFK